MVELHRIEMVQSEMISEGSSPILPCYSILICTFILCGQVMLKNRILLGGGEGQGELLCVPAQQ